MNYAALRKLIKNGDIDGVRQAIDTNPELLHTHDPLGDHWEERTAMHCAARYVHLDIIKLLVARGAEVYSNPMNTYPPVFIAATGLIDPKPKRLSITS